MSSTGTNGSGTPTGTSVGSNPNLNVSRPNSTTRPVPSPKPNTTANSVVSQQNEVSLPSYDSNDIQSLVRTLIRCIMRTFYDIPKSLVVEYIFHHDRIKLEDLAVRLCVDTKTAQSYIQEFKRDKYILEEHRLESTEGGKGGLRNQDRFYYKFDAPVFVNIVRYRLHELRVQIEKGGRNPKYFGSHYKCEPCGIDYDEFAVPKLFNPQEGAFFCPNCGGIIEKGAQNDDETTNGNRQIVNVSLFIEQFKSIFEILDHIEKLMNQDQQMRQAMNADALMTNGYSGSNLSIPLNRDNSNSQHRSQSANVFDRTRTLNHNVEIIFEKDEEDPYAQVDIDETSNMEASISSSRGPGKPGKKSTKAAQSNANDGTNSSATKSTTKKVPYEPKPLPIWFEQPAVLTENDDEHLSKTSSNHSSTLSRQLSNPKLNKSTTIHDIKQMLLMHESHRKRATLFPTMEDSLSPPTPQQLTRLNTSQSTSSLPQFPTNTGVVSTTNHAIDEDDAASSLFHLTNEDSVHHMDIDTNG